jgi:hypothetical protein
VGLHLGGTHPGAPLLLAAGYTAHAVHKLHEAKALADKADKSDAEKRERKRLLLRGCAHAADAALHVMIAAPALEEALPQLIRANVNEPAIVRAFNLVKV